MKIKISPFIYTIIFLIIFFVLYKGLQNSNIYTPNLKMEKNIPSFKAKIFENGNFVSEKIFQKDKFYLLNIWASWCVPCREEHSFLKKLNKEKKIEIIGLNYKDDKKNAKIFLNELGNPYNIVLLDDRPLKILFILLTPRMPPETLGSHLEKTYLFVFLGGGCVDQGR